jgi:hypothetical protein
MEQGGRLWSRWPTDAPEGVLGSLALG